MWGKIIGFIGTALKSIYLYVIAALLILLLVSSAIGMYYKFRFDRSRTQELKEVIAAQKELIKIQAKMAAEVEAHGKRITAIVVETRAVSAKIDNLNAEEKCQNEEYYLILDSISTRFNDGLRD